MSRLESIIAGLSPRWAAKRAYYRTILGEARAYDAARTGRRTAGWITSNASANVEIAAGAALTRARARDLARNNPWAAKALSVLPAKVCGVGIVPRMIVPKGEEARRQAAAESWNAFVENSDPEGVGDFYSQMKLAARSMFESGEALIRFIPRPSSWKLPVPLQLQVLEPDYLDAARTQSLPGGGAIIQGVEYQADGRRAAYWLFDEHPGDSFPRLGIGPRGLSSRRVPASEVMHLFDRVRPGQARGVPILAPVALKLRDIDDFDDAELMRKKIAACFAAFVKKTPTANELDARAPNTDAASGKRLENFRPGMIEYLREGEDVDFGAPPSADGYAEYMKMQLHAVAAGSGVTYWQLTGDMSDANLSSIRAGTLDFWDLVDSWQWHTVIPQLCRPVWQRVDRLLYALGDRQGIGARAAWTTPARRWMDPLKEVQAQKEAMRGGLISPRAAIAEQGEDPDQLLAETAQWNAALDAAGVAFDTDARRTTTRAPAPAQSDDEPGGDPAKPGAKTDA